MDVVRIAMQEQNHLPIARTSFKGTDVQNVGVNLSYRTHRDHEPDEMG
jgi:hypothetical protein